MVVQNCSLVDMTIPRGTKMGLLENIHGETIQPMDGKKIIEQLEKEDVNPKQFKPLSPAEQKDFFKKLNLNVPEDKRKLYEQLILQNHDVFSKSKDELGKANNFSARSSPKLRIPFSKNNIKFWTNIANIWKNKCNNDLKWELCNHSKEGWRGKSGSRF